MAVDAKYDGNTMWFEVWCKHPKCGRGTHLWTTPTFPKDDIEQRNAYHSQASTLLQLHEDEHVPKKKESGA
jgi:hypothetical protein